MAFVNYEFHCDYCGEAFTDFAWAWDSENGWTHDCPSCGKRNALPDLAQPAMDFGDRVTDATIKTSVTQYYYPTSRHKTLRKRAVPVMLPVAFCTVQENEFPLAFRVKTGRKEQIADYQEDVRIVDVRQYGNTLWAKDGNYAFGGVSKNRPVEIQTVDQWAKQREERARPIIQDCPYEEGVSVIVSDTLTKKQTSLQEWAGQYIACNGELWFQVYEPLYLINDGFYWTSLNVSWDVPRNYEFSFPANEREKALMALPERCRAYYTETPMIEILIPEACRLQRIDIGDRTQNEIQEIVALADKDGCNAVLQELCHFAPLNQELGFEILSLWNKWDSAKPGVRPTIEHIFELATGVVFRTYVDRTYEKLIARGK